MASSSLLHTDPRARLSVADALRHPFVHLPKVQMDHLLSGSSPISPRASYSPVTRTRATSVVDGVTAVPVMREDAFSGSEDPSNTASTTSTATVSVPVPTPTITTEKAKRNFHSLLRHLAAKVIAKSPKNDQHRPRNVSAPPDVTTPQHWYYHSSAFLTFCC